MSDFQHLIEAGKDVDRWHAEWENASARMDIAKMKKAMAHLLSQHEPVHSLGIDREKLRIALSFIQHQDLNRVMRDIQGAK